MLKVSVKERGHAEDLVRSLVARFGMKEVKVVDCVYGIVEFGYNERI